MAREIKVGTFGASKSIPDGENEPYIIETSAGERISDEIWGPGGSDTHTVTGELRVIKMGPNLSIRDPQGPAESSGGREPQINVQPDPTTQVGAHPAPPIEETAQRRERQRQARPQQQVRAEIERSQVQKSLRRSPAEVQIQQQASGGGSSSQGADFFNTVTATIKANLWETLAGIVVVVVGYNVLTS